MPEPAVIPFEQYFSVSEDLVNIFERQLSTLSEKVRERYLEPEKMAAMQQFVESGSQPPPETFEEIPGAARVAPPAEMEPTINIFGMLIPQKTFMIGVAAVLGVILLTTK